MLVIGSGFQAAAFFFQFLAPPFPLFVLSFGIGGIGMAFQVGITHEERAGLGIDNTFFTHFRKHLQTASLRVSKMTQNIKWVLYMLHMVQPFPNPPIR